MTPNPGKNLWMSFVRTGIPMAVGAVLTWLARKTGVVIDDSTKAYLLIYVQGLVAGVYYVLVRLIETYVSPRISFLLGDFRKGHTEPIYPDAHETTVVPPADQGPGA